jgi:hypothetical protein
MSIPSSPTLKDVQAFDPFETSMIKGVICVDIGPDIIQKTRAAAQRNSSNSRSPRQLRAEEMLFLSIIDASRHRGVSTREARSWGGDISLGSLITGFSGYRNFSAIFKSEIVRRLIG